MLFHFLEYPRMISKNYTQRQELRNKINELQKELEILSTISEVSSPIKEYSYALMIL